MRYLLLLFFVHFGLSGQCQDTVSNNLLWKIEHTELAQPSFLYGTIHLIPEDQFNFPDTLLKICNHTETVIMEMDIMNLSPDIMGSLVMEEDSLLDLFTEPQQDSILNWVDTALHIELWQFKMSFGKLKPFVFSTFLQTGGDMSAYESYDMTINTLYKDQNKALIGLESFEEQISFFDALSREQQVEMVLATIRLKTSEADENEIYEVYKNQEINKMLELTTEEHTYIDPEIFIDGRNVQWIPKIIENIQKKSALIAVGAGHLAGEKGLINLLKKEGYTLTPIEL